MHFSVLVGCQASWSNINSTWCCDGACGRNSGAPTETALRMQSMRCGEGVLGHRRDVRRIPPPRKRRQTQPSAIHAGRILSAITQVQISELRGGAVKARSPEGSARSAEALNGAEHSSILARVMAGCPCSIYRHDTAHAVVAGGPGDLLTLRTLPIRSQPPVRRHLAYGIAMVSCEARGCPGTGVIDRLARHAPTSWRVRDAWVWTATRSASGNHG